MTILVTQHVPFEGPAEVAEWGFGRGHRIRLCRLWAADSLPDADEVDGLVVLGGPMSVWEGSRYPWLENERDLIRRVISDGRPVLGICLGAQQIAAALGAPVYPGSQKEIGFYPIELDHGTLRRFLGTSTTVPSRLTVFHWHGDTFDLPDGAERIASSPVTENQGFVLGSNTVALQFHLESNAESVTSLTRASAGEISGGTYQVPIARALSLMLRDEARYSGQCRSLLRPVLDKLFGVPRAV